MQHEIVIDTTVTFFVLCNLPRALAGSKWLVRVVRYQSAQQRTSDLRALRQNAQKLLLTETIVQCARIDVGH